MGRRIQLLDEARDDLAWGRDFYESKQPGVGDYFAAVLIADIESLRFMAGTHRIVLGFHRALCRRFPFGIFYLIEDGIVRIYAVLDLRRDPAWIRRRLGTS